MLAQMWFFIYDKKTIIITTIKRLLKRVLFSEIGAKLLRYKFFTLLMDSDEKAAPAAFLIVTLTEKNGRKKGGRERNGFNLGFKSEIPMVTILSYFVSYVRLEKKDFAIFTPPKSKLFFYFYIFWNLLIMHFILKIGGMFISNFC